MKDLILSVKNLNKKFSENNNRNYTEEIILKNISFNLYKGEIIAILGRSGSGKSTLLNVISGIDKDYRGNVKINSKKNVAYMFQDNLLFEWKRVIENCTFAPLIANKYCKNFDKVKIYEKARKLISIFKLKNIENFETSYPNKLSGGMKKRVALIRTLLIETDLILLDEPFSSLDYNNKILIIDYLKKYCKIENKSLIIVTHNIEEAKKISDKIYVLKNKKLLKYEV